MGEALSPSHGTEAGKRLPSVPILQFMVHSPSVKTASPSHSLSNQWSPTGRVHVAAGTHQCCVPKKQGRSWAGHGRPSMLCAQETGLQLGWPCGSLHLRPSSLQGDTGDFRSNSHKACTWNLYFPGRSGSRLHKSKRKTGWEGTLPPPSSGSTVTVCRRITTLLAPGCPPLSNAVDPGGARCALPAHACALLLLQAPCTQCLPLLFLLSFSFFFLVLCMYMYF